MPTSGDLLHSEWRQLKRSYRRAVAITGLELVLDGYPLELRNPWDPEPEVDGDGDEALNDGDIA